MGNGFDTEYYYYETEGQCENGGLSNHLENGKESPTGETPDNINNFTVSLNLMIEKIDVND